MKVLPFGPSQSWETEERGLVFFGIVPWGFLLLLLLFHFDEKTSRFGRRRRRNYVWTYVWVFVLMNDRMTEERKIKLCNLCWWWWWWWCVKLWFIISVENCKRTKFRRRNSFVFVNFVALPQPFVHIAVVVATATATKELDKFQDTTFPLYLKDTTALQKERKKERVFTHRFQSRWVIIVVIWWIRRRFGERSADDVVLLLLWLLLLPLLWLHHRCCGEIWRDVWAVAFTRCRDTHCVGENFSKENKKLEEKHSRTNEHSWMVFRSHFSFHHKHGPFVVYETFFNSDKTHGNSNNGSSSGRFRKQSSSSLTPRKKHTYVCIYKNEPGFPLQILSGQGDSVNNLWQADRRRGEDLTWQDS